MTFQTFVARRSRSRATAATPDASVAVILVVMMSLVFAPVIGFHLVAAFAPATPESTVQLRSAVTAIPPG